jgi:Skp family chaperone for outer membrane proteins
MSFVKQHMFKVILGVALVSAFAMPASAQQLKIGVVNIPVLMERSPQTKAAMDALQEEFAPRVSGKAERVRRVDGQGAKRRRRDG